MMLSLTHFHTFRPTGFFSTSHTNYPIHLISVEREREKTKTKERELLDLIVKINNEKLQKIKNKKNRSCSYPSWDFQFFFH
jgi:hypothetical protein